jgi:hypothetical protein
MINKNAIIAENTKSCHQKGTLFEVTTIKKDEPTKPTNYPTISQLVRGCLMKPSLNHQYMVSDVVLDNVIIKLLKPSESFLTYKDVANFSKVNCLYQEMIHDGVRLRTLDFSQLRELRIGYVEQTAIQPSHVDMATACAIHYTLHSGMVIRYSRGKYVGENRDVTQILCDVSPHVDETNAAHIKWILTQGCPTRISFGETFAMKASIILKENQATFEMYPEIVTKRMSKEDRYSHLLPVKLWVLHFSPWCRHTEQGMQVKPGKNPRIIFDASTKSHPHEVVLNKITTTKLLGEVAVPVTLLSQAHLA